MKELESSLIEIVNTKKSACRFHGIRRIDEIRGKL